MDDPRGRATLPTTTLRTAPSLTASLLTPLAVPRGRWATFGGVNYADRTDPILIPLSLATFLHSVAFFSSLLFPFETIGIAYRTVFQMLATDVKVRSHLPHACTPRPLPTTPVLLPPSHPPAR